MCVYVRDAMVRVMGGRPWVDGWWMVGDGRGRGGGGVVANGSGRGASGWLSGW